jgi:DNA-binding transcriptional ArsR family regulator
MNENLGVSRIANLLADPARAAMLRALIDGTVRPAGELAYAANVSAQSASAHLAKLVGGGLLACESHGRHRYFRIASAEVADAFETLAALGAGIVSRNPPPRKAAEIPFIQARTCYDHLAGETAVRICEGMLKARWLIADGRDFTLTSLGKTNLAALGVDADSARRNRRSFARACVDLTQRRVHLGGALGAALLKLCIARSWVLTNRRSRVVNITPRGNDAFAKLFA